MEFRILGPLEVRAEGEDLTPKGQKQRELLATLLLNVNEVVSADRLIDALWGASPPKTAAKSLQVLLSQLRKALEPNRAPGEAGRLILTRQPGYMLQLEGERLDSVRFRMLAAEGRQALLAGDHAVAAEKLDEALGLWRGEPLADLAYADFARAEASRLEELRLAALEDRIEADLAGGRHAEVIGELERLVADEPLRERPRALLMLALYRAGRQAQALDVYQEARRALVDGLGIEPGRELKELQSAILEQDPALELELPVERPQETAPTAARRAEDSEVSGSFVGRANELAEFRAALDDALAGRSSLFLIAGEPGIGKSRLADEATALAQAQGAIVCWGRCWEAGGAPAYWPWVQALRAYIREGDEAKVREQLEPGAADIARMLPELRDLFPDLPPPPSLDPEGARFRLFDSTASFLRAAGEAQPVVLVLDDVHAADKPSLLLIQFLARTLRRARLLVVAAYRDTEPREDDALAEALADARREPVTRGVRLGGLDASEVARVIATITGTDPNDELVTAIHRETEGNPLFVGELVRLLASEGRLAEVAKSPWDASIPQGVREVIGHRLRHLSAGCKRLLSTASVLGRDFRLDVLAAVSDGTDEELHAPLDEAQAAGVAVDLPTGRGGLRFSHALIRDSLYGDLSTAERLRLHRRAMEALEERFGPDSDAHLAELAYHSLEAAPGGDVDKAVEYARRAGGQAASLLAYEEAARLYRMGLDALELKTPADEATRCELLLALGDAQARGGDVPAAMETFLRAAEIARRLNAPEQLARAALGYGGRWIWFRAGKDRRLIPLLEDALEALPEGDSELRAMLLARLAGALRDHPVPDRRAALTRESVEMARRLGDPQTLAHAVGGTYSAFSWPRDTDEWLAMARELIRVGEEIGDKEQAFFGHFHAFGACMVGGDVRAADSEFESAQRLADELRQPSQTWLTLVEEATRDVFMGRLDRAEEVMRRAADLGSRAQGLDATYWYVTNLQGWALRREQGRLPEIEDSLKSYVGDHQGVFVFRCVLASVYSELGRGQAAREELDRLTAEAFADVGTEWFAGASLLAGVCADLEDSERAVPVYEALSPYGDFNVYAHPEVALGSASRPLGLLAATMSRWDDAERHFERALEMNRRMGTPLWVAHTQHDHGRALMRRGTAEQGERAVALLEAARSGYAELGMEAWQRRAGQDLAAIA